MRFNEVMRKAQRVRGRIREQGSRRALAFSLLRLSEMLYQEREFISDSDWDSLIYDDLATSMPPKPTQASVGSSSAIGRMGRINWLIPIVGPNTGGVATIIQLAPVLAAHGYESTICVINQQQQPEDAVRYEQMFRASYASTGLAIRVLNRPLELSQIPAAAITVATAWPTAYIVDRLAIPTKKMYLVQDYEPWFHANGSNALLAAHSYTLDLHHISLGNWLQEELFIRYGKASFPLGFPVDTAAFAPRPTTRSQRFRVAMYVRRSTERRSVNLGILALRQFAAQVGKDAEVLLFGEAGLPAREGFTILGPLSQSQCVALYSSVDVVMSLSATNMSLIPMEASACGATVLELNLPPVRKHLTHLQTAYLAEPYPEAISSGLLHLYSDRSLCSDIARRGREAVLAQPTWAAIGEALVGYLQSEL